MPANLPINITASKPHLDVSGRNFPETMHSNAQRQHPLSRRPCATTLTIRDHLAQIGFVPHSAAHPAACCAFTRLRRTPHAEKSRNRSPLAPIWFVFSSLQFRKIAQECTDRTPPTRGATKPDIYLELASFRENLHRPIPPGGRCVQAAGVPIGVPRASDR